MSNQTFQAIVISFGILVGIIFGVLGGENRINIFVVMAASALATMIFALSLLHFFPIV